MKKIYQRSLYTKNDAGNIFFMALLLPAVIAMFVLAIVTPLVLINANPNETIDNSLTMSIISILCAQGGMFLVYFLYNKLLRVNPFKASKISFKLNPINILLAVVIGAITLFGLNNIISVFDALFQKMGHIPNELPLPLDNGWWFALNLVLLAVIPAIVEELIFRGIIYNGLKQYGKVTAIVVSAVLFSLIHGNIDQTVYPFLFGLILAYIMFKTDNIIYSMLAHFINNAIVLTFNFIYTLNPSMIENVSVNEYLTAKYVLLAILFMILAFVAIFFLGKLFKKSKTNKPLDILEELPEDLNAEQLQALNSNSVTADAPQGVDRKVWENIISQKNDVMALEKAKTSGNVMLWVGLGISILMWLISL